MLEERARLDALRARRPRSPAIFWLFLGALFYIPSLRPLLLDAYRRGTDGEQRVGLLLCGAAAGWIVARLVILSMRALRKSPIPTSNGREALYALLTIPVYFVGYSLIVFSKRY